MLIHMKCKKLHDIDNTCSCVNKFYGHELSRTITNFVNTEKHEKKTKNRSV